MELFGFKIERAKKTPDPQQAFTPPVADDGTTVVAAGGFLVNTSTKRERPNPKLI